MRGRGGPTVWWHAGMLALGALLLPACGGGAAPTDAARSGAATWAPSRIEVRLAGAALGHAHPWRVEVDQVRDRIDRATVVLEGERGVALARSLHLADDLDCRDTEPRSTRALFAGEIVGIEPSFAADGAPRVQVTAFDRLHRLTRQRKSRVWEDVTDSDIASKIAEEHGLQPGASPSLTTRYESVAQYEQTDLEFLRERARRIGFHVWVDAWVLRFDRRMPVPPVKLAPRRPDGDVPLLQFHPHLSSSRQVQKVVVRGWDPVKKEKIEGSARLPTLLLAEGSDGPRDDAVFGRTVEADVGEEATTPAEAEAAARILLAALTEGLVSAEARCVGDAGLRAEHGVEVAGLGAQFDGRYFVQRATHRYDDREGGYETLLALRRDDRGLFWIPEIDDEVLVEFEHGDLRFPVIVGSLWNDKQPPPGRR